MFSFHPLVLSRADHILGSLLDQELAVKAGATEHMPAAASTPIAGISIDDVATALRSLPLPTQQRCLHALIDGEPHAAGLVLLHAFNQAVEAHKALPPQEPDCTDYALTHRTFRITGAL
jgi:hypothetical protein